MSGNRYERYGKRMLDIVVSPVFIVLGFPLALAAVILLTSQHRQSPLFFQRRYGTNRYITVCKLRTMKGERTVSLGYPVAWFGVDEYPQLFLVIFGQMSLVGPRCQPAGRLRHLLEWSEYRATKKAIASPGFYRREEGDISWKADLEELDYCCSQKTFARDLAIVLDGGKHLFTGVPEKVARQVAARKQFHQESNSELEGQ